MMDQRNDRSPADAELENRILPWSQVRIISGLSRTTVWRLQKTGDFPPSVQVSRNRVGWWQSDLLEWKRARTPRRLPEPRFACSPPAAEPQAQPPRAPLAKDVGPRSSAGRRKPAAPPNQGAFDF